jgi:hypothetical protein
MNRQQNKVHKLPMDLKVQVYGWLCDGLTVREITARLAAAGVPQAKLPSANAYTAVLRRDRDFAEFRNGKLLWEQKAEKRRWAAQYQHDGKGPQTVADLAELAILEQLHSLAEGGLLETGKDVATVAKAITSMQRTQLARSESNLKSQISDLKCQHEAELRALEEELGRKNEEIAKLQAGLEQAGKNRQISPEALAIIKQQIYGIKPTA